MLHKAATGWEPTFLLGSGEMSGGHRAAWTTSQEDQTWEKCSPNVGMREEGLVCGWPSSCTHRTTHTSHLPAWAFSEGSPRGRDHHILWTLTLKRAGSGGHFWNKLEGLEETHIGQMAALKLLEKTPSSLYAKSPFFTFFFSIFIFWRNVWCPLWQEINDYHISRLRYYILDLFKPKPSIMPCLQSRKGCDTFRPWRTTFFPNT